MFAPPPAPSPTPADCLTATTPTDEDVAYSLAYTGNTFESSAWQKTYSAETDRVRVTWLDNTNSALAFLEYLVFSCGYTDADIDNYFSEENFREQIFQDYQNLEFVTHCANSAGDLRLYEFTAEVNATSYLIRYWVKLDHSSRVLDMLFAFQPKSVSELDHYAQAVFPELSVCPK